jgi:hypothetical protein
MKLHKNIAYGYSCGSSVIALLTGKHPLIIQENIVLYRKKHHPKKDDPSFETKHIYNQDQTYWSELRHFLKKQIGKNRTVDIWNKNIKLKNFAANVNPKDWFIVLTKEHVQLINNNIVYDCNNMSGESMTWHIWKDQRIICYIKLRGYIKP